MSKFILYYAGFNIATLEEQIGVVESDDLHNWQYLGKNPQVPLHSQGVNDAIQTSNPCVLKHDGLYKMWYQGKSDSGFLSVCYAESKDGVSWKSHDKAVLSPNLSQEAGFREGFQHPHVIFDEDRNIFKMWLVVYKDGTASIGFCESVNGLVWTETKLTSLRSKNKDLKYFYPCVLKDNGLYRMWFTERVFSGRWQISYAESKDGLNWQNYEGNPIISPSYNRLISIFFEGIAKFAGIYVELPLYGVASPFVWRDGEKYLLIAHEVGPRGKLYIPMYESKDGLSWKKVKNNILPRSKLVWNGFFQADPYLYVQE